MTDQIRESGWIATLGVCLPFALAFAVCVAGQSHARDAFYQMVVDDGAGQFRLCLPLDVLDPEAPGAYDGQRNVFNISLQETHHADGARKLVFVQAKRDDAIGATWRMPEPRHRQSITLSAHAVNLRSFASHLEVSGPFLDLPGTAHDLHRATFRQGQGNLGDYLKPSDEALAQRHQISCHDWSEPVLTPTSGERYCRIMFEPEPGLQATVEVGESWLSDWPLVVAATREIVLRWRDNCAAVLP